MKRELIKSVLIVLIILIFIGTFNTYTKDLECDTEVSGILQPSIPIGNYNLGVLECHTLNKMKYFLDIQENGSYYLKGIRIWVIALSLLIYFNIKNRSLKK